jgi:hypothetical protein
MTKIEDRMSTLAARVKSECAYCCNLESVRDIATKPGTALVTMRCRHHNTYRFEVYYGGNDQPEERDDSVLMRRIARGIVDNTQLLTTIVKKCLAGCVKPDGIWDTRLLLG